jgi:transposase
MNTGPEESIMPRRARRTFPAAFKAELVRDLLTGKRSQAELCREHQLSPSLLALWKDTVLQRLDVLFQAEEQRDPQQSRITELEQLAGRQALELEILKKASRLLPGPPAPNGRSS